MLIFHTEQPPQLHQVVQQKLSHPDVDLMVSQVRDIHVWGSQFDYRKRINPNSLKLMEEPSSYTRHTTTNPEEEQAAGVQSV